MRRGRCELEKQLNTLSRVLRNVGSRRGLILLEMQQLGKVLCHTGARKTEHLGERKLSKGFGKPRLW